MVEFIGPVYSDAKWPLYRKADLFVLPTWSENFGIVVPEAIASGTPVITTVCTPWEELNTHNCGWWTEIGTEPLVEALKKFSSTEAVLAEMRTIRCIEHTGKMKFITPFVGFQVDICKAFGFDIPDGCAPVYVSNAKPVTRKRGRPAKPKVENQEL